MKWILSLLLLLGLFSFEYMQPIPSKRIGKRLAQGNCMNCHPASSEKNFSSLKGIRKLRTKIWLYNFINNPSRMIASNTEAKKLYQKWKPVVMTSFPNLTRRDIDAILDYYDSLPAH